jgi:hypothetical protein
MKKLMLSAALAFVMCSIAATAQVTGPEILRNVSDQLSTTRGYRVELRSDGLHMNDASTGNEVLAMRQMNPQQVMISGKVAELGKLAPEIRQKVMKQIALFNFSSSVGTLYVDEKTGEVTLQHNVNPRTVPAAAIAQVATQFTNSVVLQSRMLVK